MKRIGREGSIEGRVRVMWRMLAPVESLLPVYIPSPRNDLIFDRRSSDDAEGESRMMGSGLLPEGLAFFAPAATLAAGTAP